VAPDVLAFCPRCNFELVDPAAEPGDVCMPCAVYILTWRLQMPCSIAIGRMARSAEIERETADRRRRQALDRLRQQVEQLEQETDPEILENADGALSDVLWDVIHERLRAVDRQPR